MPLQTQFMTFFISPFSEPSATAELNNFLKSHRIINVEKRLIDGIRLLCYIKGNGNTLFGVISTILLFNYVITAIIL